jgi:hypothetical protein
MKKGAGSGSVPVPVSGVTHTVFEQLRIGYITIYYT